MDWSSGKWVPGPNVFFVVCCNFLFIVFIHVIPGTWSISKCCPNSKRIPSWLSNSHCGERRSHQHLMHPISAVELFPAIWRLFYIESVPGCIFSTQTRSTGISSKINCCGMTCWKRNQNVSRHLAAFFFLNSMSLGSSHPSIQCGTKPLTGDSPITACPFISDL